jgi:hypothetical protein
MNLGRLKGSFHEKSTGASGHEFQAERNQETALSLNTQGGAWIVDSGEIVFYGIP